MTKKELISKLDSLSGALDVFADEVTIYQAAKELSSLREQIDSIAESIQDDGIEEEGNERSE